eukprot:294217_1
MTEVDAKPNKFPREDYVWNIDLFVNREIALKFVCVRCNNIPREKCGFTNSKGQIYCEFCKEEMKEFVNDEYEFNHCMLLNNIIGTLCIYCPLSKQGKKQYIGDDSASDTYCKWKGSINDFTQIHSHECNFIGIICPLQIIGCPADNMAQKDLTFHFNNYNIQHLILMSQQINKCQQTIEQLTFTVNKLQNEMNNVDDNEQKKLDKIIDDLDDDIHINDEYNIIYGIGYNYGGELGLKTDGNEIKIWSKLPVSSFGNIKKIYRSYQSLFYLSSDGKLYCTGINGKGQLGLGPTKPTVDTPILNTYVNDDIILVSSGCAATHTFIMSMHNKVYGFGDNTYCQLGIKLKPKIKKHSGKHSKKGSTLLDESKTDIDDDNDKKNFVFMPAEIRFKGMINDIQCGESHTLFLNGTDGTVLACGNNKYGQCGLGTELNGCIEAVTQIKSLKHIFKIHCGQNFSICVDIDGAIYSFGQNNMGQLGLGNRKIETFAIPMKIPAFSSGKNKLNVQIQNIKCGMNHVCCLDKQGQAYTFGCNKYGRCGVNTDIKQLFSPQMVNVSNILNKNIKIVDIFCGNFHTILLTEENEYICFGSNNCGQCSIAQKDLKEIDKPYKVTKQELGINKQIIDIVCGFDTTLLLFDNQ